MVYFLQLEAYSKLFNRCSYWTIFYNKSFYEWAVKLMVSFDRLKDISLSSYSSFLKIESVGMYWENYSMGEFGGGLCGCEGYN
jgi:hypothetical protein